MNIVIYDGTFEGLLTTIYEINEYKIGQPLIHKNEPVSNTLFGTIHHVKTDKNKSNHTIKELEEKISNNGLLHLYKTFLSELKDIENVIYRYIQYAFSSQKNIENDFSNAAVLMVQQTSRKVHREKHRMEAFVRFQCTKDQLYYSIIQPDFNVLPLIAKHFKDRYADQRWLIYDALRKYGLYYDLKKVEEVQIDFSADLNNKNDLAIIHDEKEELYQQLWQQYFSSANISARKNMKLHILHMPKRYWKYLVEKKR